jgi:hypothetical protein
MVRIAIDLERESRHWRLKIAVDGQIEPSHVFACTDALLPLIVGLERTELEAHRIATAAKTEVRTFPSDIAIRMPSGRLLTFTLTRMQEP